MLVHRPHPRLGAVQAAHAQRRALVHGVPFGAGRHHVRPRGDGDPGRSDVPRGAALPRGRCPHSSRSPAIRARSTSPPCSSGSRTPACATRSRVCASTAARSSRTFLIPTIERQLELDGPVERAATALAGWARYLGRRRSGGAGVRRRRRAAAAATPPRRSPTRRRSWPTARSSRPRCRRPRASAPRSRRATAGSPRTVRSPRWRRSAQREHAVTTRRMTAPRLQHDRQHAIYMLALRQGSVDVADLASRYGVTTETIRRDLSDMQGRQAAAPRPRRRRPGRADEPRADGRGPRDGQRGGEAADRDARRSRRCRSAAR